MSEVVMTITLRPEHEEMISRAMQSGAYSGPEEVVGRALEMLHSEDEWLHGQAAQISEKIERAFEQFQRGECFTAGQSREDMRKRKADWLRERER
jgi:Arc/MetJ-type ribon-helix-helix transcriptional regulator